MIRRFSILLLMSLMLACTALADGTITLVPDSILFNGTGAVVEGHQVTISSGGTYELTGTHPDACILVQADGSDVQLRLNQVSLHREGGEAIVIDKGQPVVIETVEGTINTLSAAADNPDQQLGVIRSKGPLTITGSGTLQITGKDLSGIHTSKTLTVVQSALQITAGHHGLRAKKGIALSGAALQLNCGGKGLYSGDSEESVLADIEASDSTILLCSGADGWQATGAVTLNGCTVVQVSGKNGLQADEELDLADSMLLILSGKKAVNSPSRPSLSSYKCDIAQDSSLLLTLNDLALECAAPATLDHVTSSEGELPGCSISVNGSPL